MRAARIKIVTITSFHDTDGLIAPLEAHRELRAQISGAMVSLTPETAPFLHPPPLDGGRARLSSRQWMREPGRRWAAQHAGQARGDVISTMNDADPCLYGRCGAVSVEVWS